MTITALLDLLTVRGVSVRVDGDRVFCRATRGKVGEDVLVLVRQNKRELIRFLNLSNNGMRTERLKLVGESCGIEPWDQHGLENLLAVARQAGFQFEIGHGELAVCGPEPPGELWRLIREQAGGLAGLLG